MSTQTDYHFDMLMQPAVDLWSKRTGLPRDEAGCHLKCVTALIPALLEAFPGLSMDAVRDEAALLVSGEASTLLSPLVNMMALLEHPTEPGEFGIAIGFTSNTVYWRRTIYIDKLTDGEVPTAPPTVVNGKRTWPLYPATVPLCLHPKEERGKDHMCTPEQRPAIFAGKGIGDNLKKPFTPLTTEELTTH